MDWRGVIIAEGLSDPAIINRYSVYRAVITEDGMLIDYEGNTGRWHIYYVECEREEIDKIEAYIVRGWYAHFWDREKIIVVYNDEQFELDRNDKDTWKKAIAHGKAQGIPENQLDFPTD